ncbi:DUF1642 domain-containing protein [Enterococcus faecium]|nr:DUF1642 domain-containing protein [Enterococcus faecium]
MNKQKLIDKWENKTGAPSYEISDFSINPSKNDMYIAGYGVARTEIIKDLKQLDEPQKPVVPKFVAEWFEDAKDNLETSIFYECVRAMEICKEDRNEFHQWFANSKNNPIETLIRMKDGYEVEKEPMYRVKLGEGYFVEYQGRGALIMPDCNKEIKIFDSKSDAERTAQTIGGTVEEVAEG